MEKSLYMLSLVAALSACGGDRNDVEGSTLAAASVGDPRVSVYTHIKLVGGIQQRTDFALAPKRSGEEGSPLAAYKLSCPTSALLQGLGYQASFVPPQRQIGAPPCLVDQNGVLKPDVPIECGFAKQVSDNAINWPTVKCDDPNGAKLFTDAAAGKVYLRFPGFGDKLYEPGCAQLIRAMGKDPAAPDATGANFAAIVGDENVYDLSCRYASDPRASLEQACWDGSGSTDSEKHWLRKAVAGASCEDTLQKLKSTSLVITTLNLSSARLNGEQVGDLSVLLGFPELDKIEVLDLTGQAQVTGLSVLANEARLPKLKKLILSANNATDLRFLERWQHDAGFEVVLAADNPGLFYEGVTPETCPMPERLNDRTPNASISRLCAASLKFYRLCNDAFAAAEKRKTVGFLVKTACDGMEDSSRPAWCAEPRGSSACEEKARAVYYGVTELSAEGAGISDLEPLSEMRHLAKVNLSRNPIARETLKYLSDIEGLDTLDLSDVDVGSAASLPVKRGLGSLILARSGLDDLGALATEELKASLVVLVVDGNGALGNFAALRGFDKLMMLGAARTGLLSGSRRDANIDVVASLPRLAYLNASATGLDNAGARVLAQRRFPALLGLYIGGNALQGELGSMGFGGISLAKLAALDVSGNRLTGVNNVAREGDGGYGAEEALRIPARPATPGDDGTAIDFLVPAFGLFGNPVGHGESCPTNHYYSSISAYCSGI